MRTTFAGQGWMAHREMRFGIASVAGFRAATWKLWTDGASEKPSLYLARRAPGGQLKTSLHASGSWHTSYSSQTFDAAVKPIAHDGTDRFIQSWPRPTPIAPGLVLALRIITPASAVCSPMSRADDGVMWLPNAPEGKATEIDIVLAAASTPIADWPGKRSMGTALAGSLPVGGAETAWVVHRVVELPRESPLPPGAAARFYKGRSAADLDDGNLRAIAFGSEPDGSRTIWDIAVEKCQRTSAST